MSRPATAIVPDCALYTPFRDVHRAAIRGRRSGVTQVALADPREHVAAP
jgi:hypothetical protein